MPTSTPPDGPKRSRPAQDIHPEGADSGPPRLEESLMWNAMSYLISGPVLFGGIGWALDRWLGTSWLVAVGIVGGMALSLYVIWFRYGTQRLPR